VNRLAFVCLFIAVSASPLMAEEAPSNGFTVRPIGEVAKEADRSVIVLDEEFEPGLLGLDGFSHIYVFWWFSLNDEPAKRETLQVHPMGNRRNPLTGVFATRSPRRPNLVALTLCKIVAIKGNVIEVEKIDAFDKTPVIDIKPYIPGYDTAEGATIPEWLEKARQRREPKG